MLNKLNKDKLFYIFIFLIILIKIYLLFYNPKPIVSTGVSWTWFDFYNSKQFILNASSFTDPGHPGTPIYYIHATILKIFGTKIKNFELFQNINHVLYIFIYFFSFQYFYMYFKKKISSLYIISFFFLLFSYQISFTYLEIASLSVYLLPTCLVLIVQSFKIYDDANLKIILKFCFTIIFAISTKFALLPFVCILYLGFCFSIIEQKKKLKLFLVANISMLFFLIVLNFPILGRLPGSLWLILLERPDTSITISQIWVSLKISLTALKKENLLLPILIIIFFLGNVFLIIKNTTVKKKNFFFILNLFFLLSFFYTFVAVGETINATYNYTYERDIDKDIFFRNNYPYIFFIFLLFYQIKNYSHIFQKVLIAISFAVFFISFHHYLDYRKKTILQSASYSYELKQKLKKYIDIKNDNFSYWSTYKKYGINDEIIHFKGNYVWGNEKFNEEIIDQYPNIRFLRINDIVNKINEKKDKKEQLSTPKTKIRLLLKNNIVDKYEKFINDNFNTFFYEVFSTKSFKNLSIFLGDPRRSGEVYTGQETRPINLKLIAFTFPKNPNDFRENYHHIIEYINKTIPIERIVKENVLEDLWYFILLKD